MSQSTIRLAPPGTPGYTGVYRWRGDVLMAMRPDGTWAPLAPWDLFLSKKAVAA